MKQLSTTSEAPDVKLMPLRPLPGLPDAFCATLWAPSMVRPRRITWIELGKPLALSLTLTPVVLELSTPPSVFEQSMVIDLVAVTAPKPPGSRQLISPPAAVFEIAPAKVLQGAVRLHGLRSSPTPDTQVRVACACAAVAPKMTGSIIAKIASK